MYILYQGEVSVIAGEDDKITTVLHENQVFGERALSNDEKRTATIIANMPKTICLALSQKEYKDIVYVRCSLESTSL
jgi:CRP-like cAMP-binding protein